MIVIPMAGESSRFFNAGYTKPKFQLELKSRPLFDWTVLSFQHYFKSEAFLFIAREEHSAFVKERIQKLGIKTWEVTSLTTPTRGQAETVYLGIEKAKCDGDEPLFIFNIDTIRPGYRAPTWLHTCDGYLEVFKGEGENWSYVRPDASDSLLVAETAEKQPISNLCCTGLYYFAQAEDFRGVFHWGNENLDKMNVREYYIAPLYNELIRQQKKIKFQEITKEEVLFSGTPKEYEDLKNSDYLDLSSSTKV